MASQVPSCETRTGTPCPLKAGFQSSRTIGTIASRDIGLVARGVSGKKGAPVQLRPPTDQSQYVRRESFDPSTWFCLISVDPGGRVRRATPCCVAWSKLERDKGNLTRLRRRGPPLARPRLLKIWGRERRTNSCGCWLYVLLCQYRDVG